jgi:hypothetical protein
VTLAALALLTLLAGRDPASQTWKPVVRPAAPEDAVEPPASEVPYDASQPPPGSKEDQALWTALQRDVGLSNVELARLVQATYRLKYGKYHDVLQGQAGEAAAKATALQERLRSALAAAVAAVPERPGVFRCRHVLLDFGQRMDAPRGSALAKELPAVRGEAQDCAQRMSALLAAVRPAANEVDASLAAIDQWVGRARPLPPADGKAPASTETTNAALKEARP